MLPSFDKLSKMLIQEKRLGYKNKAVLGGFEKLAPNWHQEAAAEAITLVQQAVVEEVVSGLSRYPDISEEERPRFLHQMLVRLHKADETPKTAAEATETEDQDRADELPPPPPPLTAKGEQATPPCETPASRYKRDLRQEEKPLTEESSRAILPSVAPPGMKTGGHVFNAASSREAPVSGYKRDLREEEKLLTEEEKEEPPPRPKKSPPLPAGVGLEAPVTKLPGIKTGMADKLSKLGIHTIGDFLHLYPRRYDDYRSLKTINQLRYGDEVTIIGQVWESRQRDTRQKRPIVTTTISDGTAMIEATWFNQPWLTSKLTPGKQIVLSGKVDEYLGRLVMQSPEWEELDKDLIHTGRMVPVYPLTQGLTAKWLRNQVKRTVDYWASRLSDHLPHEMRQRIGLPALGEAIEQIHFPDDWEKLEAARRRLAFDELLLIQLGVLRQRQAWRAQQGQALDIPPTALEQLLAALPFALTGAQRRAIEQIVADLKQSIPMSRMLQGDVGSGKTVVALAAMVLTAHNGGQAVILAPTEVLAEQHFRGMHKLLAPIGQALGREFTLDILTGSSPTTKRREILAGLESGTLDMLVGTHAIIQGKVQFKQLQLAVVDEQHRFGVEQRAALRGKGVHPHILVMTATPIPRTLNLTLYGDLDLSIIDEMPPGRQTIQTRWLRPDERERAYSFIQSQVEKGRQAFIICPLVEESEMLETKSAVEEHKRLQKEIFPRLKLALLHGRMKSKEKEQVMAAFRDGEAQILVSTSVVEVGIDVPNATVVLIDGANRFGLAQLHQFRGRVGRGEHQSYCLLLADNAGQEAQERLKAVETIHDGFQLAERDLQLRGPGEFFGTRQSGLPDLKLVKLSDAKLLEVARQEAQLIFQTTPDLSQSPLGRKLENFWNSRSDLS